MKKVLFALLIVIVSACGTGGKKPKEAPTEELKWSVKMANTVLADCDSLIYYSNGRPRWTYDVAFLGMAVDKLGSVDAKYSTFLDDWVNYFIKDDGSIFQYRLESYNIDLVLPGRAVLATYARNPQEKYVTALKKLISQLETQPKTNCGGFWHKQIYPWQMWLDGIYMGSSFAAAYAKTFDAPEWFDVATTQTKMIYEKTLDSESGLLMHAWDESREQKWCDPETGKSQYPWSRATGWYLLAITDILDVLPQDHPDRADLITILQKTSEALLKVRDPESGIWYQVLNHGGREGNYLEASGSAMFTYVFAKGARLGYLDSSYRNVAESAFDGIIKELVTVDEQGLVTLHNICGGCGLGGNPYRDGSYEYYINEKRFDNDTKGVAPFILAAIELDR